MDGELSEKAKSFFDGVFPIWPRPGRSWNSSAEKFHSPSGEDANADAPLWGDCSFFAGWRH
jgi:hypothetical protein